MSSCYDQDGENEIQTKDYHILLSVLWMTKNAKTLTWQTSFVVFLYSTLGQEGYLSGHGTIPIDTDNARIGVSENLWALLFDHYVCLLVAQIVYKTRSKDKRIKPSVTGCKKCYVIDDYKIRIKQKLLPRQCHIFWVFEIKKLNEFLSKSSLRCNQ